MEQYKNLDIVEVPLGSPHFHEKVERFLGANGLRMEELDAYYTVQDADGNIIAGAGISGDIIKCVAVLSDMRSEGLLTPLISRIIAGRGNLKVFTKPEYQSLFESLGFKLLAKAPLAILLENGRGLQQYCEYLNNYSHAAEENYFLGHRPKNQFPSASATPSRTNTTSTIAAEAPSASTTPTRKIGVVVMNANPFTLGHKYLIDKAREQVDQLFVIPVKEDVSMFPYTERLLMIKSGISHASEEKYFSGHRQKNQFSSASTTPARAHVEVLDGSSYSISAATFPTYFLKDLSEASETQMRLDLDLFCKHIAPALGATVRFAGSEPTDKLTAQYNKLMAEVLPKHGIDFVEIDRLSTAGVTSCISSVQFSSHSPAPTGESVVSASKVREALVEGNYKTAAAMCPVTTSPYLLAALAERALRMELDTPLKPGLVCPESNGAHKDMDYGTMLKGIAAIRPFFPRIAMAGSPEELKQLGIDAEAAMMAATGGVNTHRGAIFAIGLALNVAGRDYQLVDNKLFIESRRLPESLATLAKQLIDSNLQNTPTSFIGAKRIALTGYKQLFEDWLPYYRRLPVAAGNDGRVQALLLHIMCTLDDTCIIKRVGKERAEQLKEEIRRSSRRMTDICQQFEAEGISPGGAADMVALTIFFDSII